MSADMIERYLEWRQENEGKLMDVSPKAFGLEEALVTLQRDFTSSGSYNYDFESLEAAAWEVASAYRELHADG